MARTRSVGLRRSRMTALAVAVAVGAGGVGLANWASADGTFPYRATYAGGVTSAAPDQGAAESELRSSYANWKRLYVTGDGAGGNRRVVSRTGCAGEGQADTVSEAQGYGAVISMYMNDRETFDALWRYTKSKLNSRGLMGWCVRPDGSFEGGVGGGASATDGDTDIAWGLVFADKLWGSGGSVDYAAEARSMIKAIRAHSIQDDTFMLTGGDTQKHHVNTNPSYWDPAIYRVFAQFSGDDSWNRVAQVTYDIAGKIQNHDNGTGLVPEDSTIDGTKAGNYSYDFGYNAVRYPWRIVKDYLWHGTSQARTNVDRLNAFWKSQGGLQNAVDGYTITGAKTGKWRGAALTSMAAAGYMTGTDTTAARSAYDLNVKTVDGDSWGYYGNSLRMLSLLMMTGNMPNLYAGQGGTGGDGGSSGGGDVRSGSKALQVSPTGSWKSTTQFPGVAQDTQYRATIHVKGSGRVQLRAHAGVWGAELGETNCEATGSWQACSLTFSSGSNGQVTFRVTDPAAGGSVSIDDASLTPAAGGNDVLSNGGFESKDGWSVENPFSL